MRLQKLTFTKQDLEKLPESERVFFIQILNFLTELNLLNKISVSYLDKTDNEIADKAIYCHKIFLTLMTAGKLYEGWKILQSDFFKGASKEIEPNLSERGKECLISIKRYFSKENHLERIRNKFAFHSDRDEIVALYKSFPKDEPFELYWSEYISNSFSTTYFDVLTGILTGISLDKETALNKTFSENISKIQLLFRNLIGELVQYFYTKNFNEIEDVDVPEQINIYNPSIPFFFDGKFLEK